MINIKNIIETTLVPHSAFVDATKRLTQCFAYADGASEPICIALVGESRTGKSRVLEECYLSQPKHRNADGLTIPILRVKTPSKPTVKSLAELMLRALEDPMFSSGTENSKTDRLKTLMVNTKTKMVIIDEFQHFYDKTSHKIMHHVADWLKILVDDTGVALVVAGLPSCQAVISQNEQLDGRFLSPIFMPRFDWQDDLQREEFISILGAFHETLSKHFDLPLLDGDDMAFRCYCGTGGLIGYLTKFLRQAVWNSLDSGNKSIGLADLLLAHDQSVWKRDGLISLPSPFSKAFCTDQTELLLSQIRNIGTPSDECATTKQSERNMSGRAQTSKSVLTAS